MDLYCQRCGEPYAMDELWGFEDSEFKGARRAFIDGAGCPCCVWGKKAPSKRPARAEMASILCDILGDDIDGIACEMEDLEYLPWE